MGACTSWFCCSMVGVMWLLPGNSGYSPQIPIAMSGIRGMGFLMKYHIEAGGGQLPPRLSSLLIKVSVGERLVGRWSAVETTCDEAPGPELMGLNTCLVL